MQNLRNMQASHTAPVLAGLVSGASPAPARQQQAGAANGTPDQSFQQTLNRQIESRHTEQRSNERHGERASDSRPAQAAAPAPQAPASSARPAQADKAPAQASGQEAQEQTKAPTGEPVAATETAAADSAAAAVADAAIPAEASDTLDAATLTPVADMLAMMAAYYQPQVAVADTRPQAGAGELAERARSSVTASAAVAVETDPQAAAAPAVQAAAKQELAPVLEQAAAADFDAALAQAGAEQAPVALAPQVQAKAAEVVADVAVPVAPRASHASKEFKVDVAVQTEQAPAAAAPSVLPAAPKAQAAVSALPGERPATDAGPELKAATASSAPQETRSVAAPTQDARAQQTAQPPAQPPAAAAVDVSAMTAVRAREAAAPAAAPREAVGAAGPLSGPVSQASLEVAKAAAGADKIPARVGTPGWDQQVGQKVIFMAAGGTQTAQLTLNPPDLGPLQVVLSVNNDQTNVAFTSAAPEVRQALEAALPKLRETMGEAGISLGSATVGTGMPDQQQAQGDAQRGNGHGGSAARAERLAQQAQTDSNLAASRPPARSVPRGAVDTFA
jgi:flagellar hook-length control protein FliK